MKPSNLVKACLTGALLLSLASMSVRAATNVIDFNTDPAATALYRDIGAGEWRPTGGASGAANDGYLKVTDAAGGQVTKLVFRDLEPGLVVKSFIFECDLRIGGGTARPADGFSINYVDVNDPMITNADAGTASEIGDYAGTDNEASLPEEGSRTGLGIGFDTWQSATISGVQDIVGISIRVNGALIAQLPVPLKPNNIFSPGEPNPTGNELYAGPEYDYNGVPNRNLATNDPNYAFSMQTGALNTTDDLNGDGAVDGGDAGTAQPPFADDPVEWAKWIKNLKWEKFRAEVSDLGAVKIFWKGVELTPAGGIATSFTPIPGRLVFGGRTGGAWEVHHVDNIRLVTIPAETLIVGNASGTPIGFTITVSDSGPSIANTNTIVLRLNGQTVTPTRVSKTGGLTSIEFSNAAAPFTSGTTNTVSLTIQDTRGISASGDRTFVVPAYQTLSAAHAVTGVDTTKPGFKIRVHQVATGQPNTVARAERQLEGLVGANIAAPPGGDGYYIDDGVINFNQDAPGNAGTYNSNNNFEDKPIPGIDVATSTDNIAAEILSFLHFPEAGVYTLIFNSDDGFRTTISANPQEVVNSVLVSQFDGGRGAADTAATILVPTAGYYPVRTVWFEGGGGANFEWSAISPSGVRALINDATTAGSVKAYRERTGNRPAAIRFTSPVRQSGSPYPPNLQIHADITDGTAAVDQSTVKLWLDGTDVTSQAQVNRVAPNTEITFTPASLLAAGSSHTISVVYREAGSSISTTGTVAFTVQNYATLPISLMTAPGTGSQPGFRIKTYVVNIDNQNSLTLTEDELAGLLGTNLADLALFDPNTHFINRDTVINFDIAAGSPGNFPNDEPFPGLPGTGTRDGGNGNSALEALTYLDFPTAGLWTMGVNSDDGFRVQAGWNPRAPTALIMGQFDGGRGASDTIFSFVVAEPGVYPIRLIWENAGGGANLEWFTVSPTGQRLLVNDTAAGSLKAFRNRSGFQSFRIGLNFGADEANNSNSGQLAATAVAGIAGAEQANWNNLRLASGTSNLVADVAGTSTPILTTVRWSSPNTWASTGPGREENNRFVGPNRTLMTGYLDSGAASTTSVTVASIPAQLTSAGYDVYVYTQGGIGGKGGGYRIMDGTGTNILRDYILAQNPTNAAGYIPASANLAGVNPTGTQTGASRRYAVANVVVFRGLTSPNIQVQAVTGSSLGVAASGTTYRAPLNAIQLVAPQVIPIPALQDVTQPGDPITPLPGTIPAGQTVESPANEQVANAIDNAFLRKYLNFNELNTGFIVTPRAGASVVTGLGLTSANDEAPRDPTSFRLEGSNNGTTYTLIAEGSIPAFSARFTRQEVSFANSTAYTSYRLIFPTVANAAAANSMQIAEVEFLGTVEAGGPALTIARDGANVRITYQGVLQAADNVLGPWNPVPGATSPFTTAATGMRFFRSR